MQAVRLNGSFQWLFLRVTEKTVVFEVRIPGAYCAGAYCAVFFIWFSSLTLWSRLFPASLMVQTTCRLFFFLRGS